MSDWRESWRDAHYPRCVRCGLRTYVSNLTGKRIDEPTATPNCPGWLEPEATRPAYPWVGSTHEVTA